MRVRATLALAGALTGIAAAAAPAGAASLTDGGCTLIPVQGTATAAAPVGTGTCPGVRPGAIVRSDVGQCTMNFLFNGSDGRRYIGTAGHCVISAPPTGGDFPVETWAPGAGPVARDASNNRIGEFAYGILRDSEEQDFSLIRLDAGPAATASAQMCHFGGPTARNDDRPGLFDDPVVLEHFGNGIGVGSVLPARSSLAFGMPSPKHVYAQGTVVPGDSGSAINSSDGRAVGVVVTTGVHSSSIGSSGLDVGTVGIVRLAPLLARAEAETGRTYTLQTAPLL